MYKSLCRCMFSFLLGKYLGIDMLGNVVGVCLTGEETAFQTDACSHQQRVKRDFRGGPVAKTLCPMQRAQV